MIVLLSIGFGCFSLHQRIEYKIDEIKEVIGMDVFMALVLVIAGGFLTYLALDAARRAK